MPKEADVEFVASLRRVLLVILGDVLIRVGMELPFYIMCYFIQTNFHVYSSVHSVLRIKSFLFHQ